MIDNIDFTDPEDVDRHFQEIAEYFLNCDLSEKEKIFNSFLDLNYKHNTEKTSQMCEAIANLYIDELKKISAKQQTKDEVYKIAIKAEKIYNQLPTQIISESYLWILSILTDKQKNKQEIKDIDSLVEDIFNKYPTEKNSSSYLWVLSNLSKHQTTDELYETLYRTDELFDVYSNQENAVAYSKILSFLSRKKLVERESLIILDTIEMIYTKYTTEYITNQYIWILSDYIAFIDNSDSESISSIVSKAEKLYSFVKTPNTLKTYVSLISNICWKLKDKALILRYANKLKDIYYNCKIKYENEDGKDIIISNLESIALSYARVLQWLASNQDTTLEISQTVDRAEDIYNKFKNNIYIAHPYSVTLLNLLDFEITEDQSLLIVEKFERLYNEFKNYKVQNVNELQLYFYIVLNYVNSLRTYSEKQLNPSVTDDKIKDIIAYVKSKIFDTISFYIKKENIGKQHIYILIYLKKQRFISYEDIKEFINKQDTKKLYDIFKDFKINVRHPKEKCLTIQDLLASIFTTIDEKEVDNRGEIKVELVKLLVNVLAIKEKLKYNGTGKDDKVGHYTKLDSIKFILGTKKKNKVENDPKLRIYNSEYMNDPSEGKTFIELFKGDKNLYDKLNELYAYNNSDERQVINKSNIYLGSYSTNIDRLPMWSQYGDDGKGCCLLFNDEFFDKEDNHDFDNKAISNQNEQTKRINNDERMHFQDENNDGNTDFINKEKEKYVLYTVVYVGNNNGEYEVYDQNNNLEVKYIKKDDISAIGKSLNELAKFNDKITNDFDTYIKATLDQIRFLFKDASYKHEDELRVVKFTDKPKLDETKPVPKLYINIEKDTKYKEIILGPKTNPSQVAPFIYNSKKVEKVTRSKIKYR